MGKNKNKKKSVTSKPAEPAAPEAKIEELPGSDEEDGGKGACETKKLKPKLGNY
jgi:hypothetical protein